MRKNLEVISLGALALTFWMTWQAFHGPHPMPAQIPTHFNAVGNADGWGSPATLLMLPVVAAVIYLTITLISLFPRTFNYPVAVTEENRARLEALTLEMITWLKAELVCFFAWIQWFILRIIQQGHGRLSPAILVVFLAAFVATLAWYMAAIFRAARAG
jgi:uncharacterized membrane protein